MTNLQNFPLYTDNFIKELAQLYKKHHIILTACSCCNGISYANIQDYMYADITEDDIIHRWTSNIGEEQ